MDCLGGLSGCPASFLADGSAAKIPKPARRRIGTWTQKTILQPSFGAIAPAMTAPRLTPMVIPEFISPMNKPLLFSLASSSTSMMTTLNTPAAPTPVIPRPIRKTVNVGAKAVTNTPKALMQADAVMYARGEKMRESLPPSGVTEDIAIR